MLSKVDTGLDQVHQCPFDCSVGNYICNVALFGHPSHLLQVRSVLVDVLEFVSDDLRIDHLHIPSGEPVDKLLSLSLPLVGGRCILRLNLLPIRVDSILVPGEENPILQCRVGDVRR